MQHINNQLCDAVATIRPDSLFASTRPSAIVVIVISTFVITTVQNVDLLLFAFPLALTPGIWDKLVVMVCLGCAPSGFTQLNLFLDLLVFPSRIDWCAPSMMSEEAAYKRTR